ncbi:MAG: hypothetical protein HUK11_01670 [Muribaculaceae bacterium]|nr:hypothetical protein [Muribaculaceae bacterium]
MKKLLLIAAAALALTATAQEQLPKAFSFTVENDGVTPACIAGILTDATANLEMQIDWGDGVLSQVYTLEDYATTWTPTEYSAVPKGNTITVYAKPEVVNYIDGSWKTGTLKWTSIDLSALTALINIEAPSNNISAIDISHNTSLTGINMSNNAIVGKFDFSANTALKTIDFSNSEVMGTNNLDGTDFTCLPNLATLKLAMNPLTNIKVAGLTKLATLTLTSCHLASIDLTGCSALKTLNGNDNDFETIDLSPCSINKPYFYLNNCKLRSITTAAAYSGNNRLQVKNNFLTFATLPAPGLFTASNFQYNPQGNIDAQVAGGVVDLSQEMPTIAENPTLVTWADGDKALVEGVDYTVEDGKFVFNVECKAAVATLTNAAFSSLTLYTNPIAIIPTGINDVEVNNNVPAVYYNLNGQRVDATERGILIEVRGDKATKVVK